MNRKAVLDECHTPPSRCRGPIMGGLAAGAGSHELPGPPRARPGPTKPSPNSRRLSPRTRSPSSLISWINVQRADQATPGRANLTPATNPTTRGTANLASAANPRTPGTTDLTTAPNPTTPRHRQPHYRRQPDGSLRRRPRPAACQATLDAANLASAPNPTTPAPPTPQPTSTPQPPAPPASLHRQTTTLDTLNVRPTQPHNHRHRQSRPCRSRNSGTADPTAASPHDSWCGCPVCTRPGAIALVRQTEAGLHTVCPLHAMYAIR